MKKLLPAVIAIFLIAQASALTLGTLSSKDRKASSGDYAQYTIELYNPGSQTVEVDVSSRLTAGDPSDVNIVHDKSITVEPSEVTSTPVGPGWFALGNGKYVELTEVPVRIYRKDDSVMGEHQFRVRILASSASDDGADVTQNVAWERDFDFMVDFRRLRSTGSSGGSFEGGQGQGPASGSGSSSGGSGESPSIGSGVAMDTVGSAVSGAQNFLDRFTGSQKSSKDGEQNEDSGEKKSDEEEETGGNKPEPSEQSNSQSEAPGGSNPDSSPGSASKSTGSFGSGVTSTTGILVAGTMLSIGYLLKVVMVG